MQNMCYFTPLPHQNVRLRRGASKVFDRSTHADFFDWQIYLLYLDHILKTWTCGIWNPTLLWWNQAGCMDTDGFARDGTYGTWWNSRHVIPEKKPRPPCGTFSELRAWNSITCHMVVWISLRTHPCEVCDLLLQGPLALQTRKIGSHPLFDLWPKIYLPTGMCFRF